MDKQKIYIFFDEIMAEYKKHFDSENKIVFDLKKSLTELSISSNIILITRQDIQMVNDWLLDNDLYQFIYTIAGPMI